MNRTQITAYGRSQMNLIHLIFIKKNQGDQKNQRHQRSIF